MRNDRSLALKLRKKGLSYKEITEELGIAKSTLHCWFKNLAWSSQIKDKLTKKAINQSKERIKKLIKFNKERWKKWRESFRKEARKEFKMLKFNKLFIAGIMLYWGEGDQNLSYPVRLSNTNYRMIALFKRFLLKVCKVQIEDIYLSLFLYPDIPIERCKNFWSDKIKIKKEQFDKVQIIYGRHPTKRLENGICAIRVKKSIWLKEKILVWISLLSKELDR